MPQERRLMMFNNLSFLNPQYLFLLLAVPLLVLWYCYFNRRRKTPVTYSQISAFGKRKTWRIRLRFIPDVLRLLVIILLIIAIARPQSYWSRTQKDKEGIDIVLAMDISSSMLAEDFKPNRLEAAKAVAKDFVEKRQDDNIGIIAFAGESYTQCPPTIDHIVVQELLGKLTTGQIDDGTAIGDGLATAVNRIKDSKTKSKAIILLTDGMNNLGSIDPLMAAEIAKKFNIRVYTIGVGNNGLAPFPYDTPFGKQYQYVEVKIDEKLLKEIAKETNGKYFRSTNKKSLQTIFGDIDKMEKTVIDTTLFEQKDELGIFIIAIALLLFISEELLRKTLFNTKP
ncbi:MAG: VWA domain-containing protein [Bacteroidales bacterium]|jgi:Ca-activated chloride channel family protein|nr:VWA domain-containing protein [Bacteroidales bacterium]